MALLLCGRWDVLRSLGSGGSGEVFLAADRYAAGALRAVKILKGGSERHLRAEFAVLAALSHPGVVRPHALAEDPERGPLLVTDWVDGADLLTAGAVLPEAGKLALIAQLLRTLAFVHARGVLHLDLKPGNVLVEAGRVRLLDFGLAGTEWSTAAGATPAWAAPEQIGGGQVDRRADLWAVGALAFALATGAPPQQREAEEAAARAPARLGEVARLLLRRDPERRPASAAAALERIGARLPDEPAEIAAWIPHAPGVVRAAAVERVEAALATGRAVAVIGPAGSGRGALLGEVLRRAAGAGRIVLRGGAGQAPLEPLLPVVRGAAAILPSGVAAPARAVLAGWLGGEAGAPVDPAALGAAAAELVAAAAERRGLLVAVDEADRLEPASRVALHELAGRRVPLLLSAEEPQEIGGVESIALPPLAPDAVARWLAGVYPDRGVPDGFAAAIHRWSGGLPAVIEEGLRALAARGIARPGVGGAPLPADLGEGDFPDRAESASRIAQRALATAREAALLLGAWRGALGLADLAAILGVQQGEARRQVEALAAEGAVAIEVEAGAAARICGEAVARAIGAAARAEELAGIHRRLAEHAARMAAAARGAEATALRAARARHLLAAGDPAAPAAALEAGLACAAGAARHEAVELLSAALQAGVGDGAARCALAAAMAALGDAEGALATYRQAAAEGAAAEAAIGAAEVLVRRGAWREAVEELERAEAPDPALRVRLLASLARALAFAGRAAEARARAEEGLLAVAPLAGQEAAEAELHAARGLALHLAGDADGALAAWEAADRAAARAGDPGRRAIAANGKAMVAHRRGNLAAAQALYEEALHQARAARDLSRAAVGHLNLGALAQERSATDVAAEQFRQAAAVGRALGDHHLVARAELNLAVLDRFVGRLEAAVAAAQAAQRAAARGGADHVRGLAAAVEGETRLLLGEIALARARLEEGLALVTGVAERLDVELALGQAELAGGASAAAAERARRVAEAAASLPAIRLRAWFLLGEALLAGASADVPAARRAIYEALALAEVHARPDVRWRLHRALFLAHRAAGEGDLARAEAVVAQRLLAASAQELPPGDRAPFLARPDRRRAREELALAGPVAAAEGSAARVLALNRRLAEERDADRLLAAIVDAAIELSGAERGFVLLPAAGGGVSIRVARGFAARAEDVPVSRSIAERVLRTGEPEHTVDALHDDRYRDQLSIHDLRLRSVICLPLQFRGERVGALYLDNRLRSRAFDDAAVALLESFADQAGIALGNAQLLAETEAARRAADEAADEVRRLAARLEEQVEQQAAELASAREALRDQPLAGIVGRSEPIRKLVRAVEKVAAVAVPVLIQGESGTGKELVARAIHTLGPRRDRPFVAVNCAALAETVLESELFGHVRGAFTGADRDRRGLFELASGGTLFLDEVADMSLGMQAKLLRTLQSGEVWKVGGRAPLRVDVRVVAATNKPLAEQVAAGLFREDLFYRLNVVTLEVPPLRERQEDLPLLVEHFLRNVRSEDGAKRRLRIEPAALAILTAHDWPGNVRELEGALRNAAIFAEKDVIRAADLAFLQQRQRTAPAGAVRLEGTVPLAEAELVLIERTLEKTNGNKALAARMLGIDRKTLYNKLRRHGGA